MRKELWFGLSLMALIVLFTIVVMPAPADMRSEHLGLLMLSLVVGAIMLGFPTAFTLMGMGVLFAWLAYRAVAPDLAVQARPDQPARARQQSAGDLPCGSVRAAI